MLRRKRNLGLRLRLFLTKKDERGGENDAEMKLPHGFLAQSRHWALDVRDSAVIEEA